MEAMTIIKPACVLLTISAIAAMSLGMVSELTAEPIAEQKKIALEAGMQAVMPDATAFELLEDLEFTNSVNTVYTTDTDGFVVIAAPNAFAGAITTMVGIDADGVITGLRVTGHSETPGLGAKATEPDFYEQFSGKSGTVAVTKDGGEIVSITSSTITSRAVSLAASDALAWVAENGGDY